MIILGTLNVPRPSHLLVFVSLEALTRFDLVGANQLSFLLPPSALPQSRFSPGSFTPWSPRYCFTWALCHGEDLTRSSTGISLRGQTSSEACLGQAGLPGFEESSQKSWVLQVTPRCQDVRPPARYTPSSCSVSSVLWGDACCDRLP